MLDASPPGPLPGEPILVKENPAHYLLVDAVRAVEAAREARRRGDADAEASASRSAVFLYFAALEGFINFVYAYSGFEDGAWQRWSTVKKWLRAPEQCLPEHGTIEDANGVVQYRSGDPIEPFARDADLVRQFRELRAARNAMLHLQPVFTLVEQERLDKHFEKTESYPATGLPKGLAHFRCQHAETAARIFAAMVDRLDFCMKGFIADLVNAPALYEYRVTDSGWDTDDSTQPAPTIE